MASPSDRPEPPNSQEPPASGASIRAEGDVFIAGSVAGRDIIIHNYYQQVVSPGPAEDDREPPAPGDPPFKGLQYFDEADADRFFGREALTARIVGRLAQTRFLAVIGASGSGKSSLIRAGVIPALRRGQRLADDSLPPTDSGHWDILTVTPTAHPLESLAAALSGEGEGVSAVSALQTELAQAPRTLALAARQRLARTGRRHGLLFVDQFEEVFTLCRSTAERDAFIDNLVGAAEPGGPLTVLVALRADFYAQCAQHAGLREVVSQQQEYIGAMSRQELLSAIVQPAALGEWKIQDGLVELMLDEVGGEPGALPLLSHALLETWARRRGRKLTLSGYTEAGGLQGAIARTAESVFEQRLSSAQRPIARMIFLRLTELGEADSPDTRRRVPFSELITRATDALTVDAVLGVLADARLVTTGTAPPNDSRVVEVAHEAIIRAWPTLRTWLNENREGLRRQRQLTEDAAEWQKLARDPGALYRGARLKNALEAAAHFPEPLSLLEQEFLDLSRADAERESAEARRLAGAARSQRILGAVAGLAVLALVGLIAFQWFLQSSREQARMTGGFNIAIARFAALAPQAGVAGSAGDEQFSLWAYESLASLFATKAGLPVQLWHDSVAPSPLGVVVDEGQTGGQTPDQLAERIGADLVIYGLITPTGNGFGQLELKFYIAPELEQDLGGLVGDYTFGAPLTVNVADPGLESQAEVFKHVNGLALVTLGLVYGRGGLSESALEYLTQAQSWQPDSPVVRFLIGQEHLFLAQQPAAAADIDASLDQAQAAFAQALALDPGYSRASIGLGSVLFYRAQRDLAANPATDCTGAQADLYRLLLETVDGASANYQKALEQEQARPGTDQTLARAAQISLALAYRLKAEVTCGLGEPVQALKWIDQGLALMGQALASLPEDGQRDYRLKAQAFQGLGTLYEWKAYLKDDDPALYREAIAAYEQCIEQGRLFPVDLFLKDEIVAKRCVPYRDRLQADYGGGSG